MCRPAGAPQLIRSSFSRQGARADKRHAFCGKLMVVPPFSDRCTYRPKHVKLITPAGPPSLLQQQQVAADIASRCRGVFALYHRAGYGSARLGTGLRERGKKSRIGVSTQIGPRAVGQVSRPLLLRQPYQFLRVIPQRVIALPQHFQGKYQHPALVAARSIIRKIIARTVQSIRMLECIRHTYAA